MSARATATATATTAAIMVLAAACGYEPPGGTELLAGDGEPPANANNEPGKAKQPGEPVNATPSSTPDGDRNDDDADGEQQQGGATQGGILCDRKRSFNAPSAVVGLPPTEHLSTPHLSADELTIYFTISGPNGIAKLGRATRPTINAPFVPDTALAVLSSANAKDNDPSESADELTLWFSSERNGQGADLFFASRSNRKEAFSAPQLVPVVNNGGAADNHPYFRTRAQELWFTSQRNGNGGERSIFVARKGATGFQSPVLVKELGTNVRHPMVTEDGLDIIFDAPDRPGTKGGTDIFTAHRDITGIPFSNVTPLAPINSAANDFAGWLSPDGCRLYFSSDRAEPSTGRHRIFVASR